MSSRFRAAQAGTDDGGDRGRGARGRGAPGHGGFGAAAWDALDDESRGPGPRFRVSGWVALWLPVLVSFVVQVPASLFVWRARHLGGWIAGQPADDVARIALALAGPLLLIGARRFPGPVVALTSAAAGAYVIVVAGDSAPPYIALAFAVVGAVVRGARVWAWISLAAAWIATITVGLVLGVSWPAAPIVAVTLALVLLLAIGESIRTRRRRYDELRRRIALRRAGEAQAERVRIARELHDVLAHSLSQINVQAGVGLHLIDSDPQAAATALANIKSSSKQALDEVRSVLGILRSGPGMDGRAGGGADGGPGGDDEAPLVPEPDLSRLPALVDTVRAQGLEVALVDTIDAAQTPRPVQLALYRIVQESLTNVLRHSGAHSVEVVLEQGTDAVTAAVTDDGRGAPPAARDGSGGHEGRGLLGMRERAELLGGRLEAGPVAGGGFRVRAAIPVPARAEQQVPHPLQESQEPQPPEAPHEPHEPGTGRRETP
ncbi:sensor histidine kinase [Herbiconiux solani]|uniref:sensor histidine kinase n=1 Tax=Herbiconiux solani TaxID=661329 RepID=UPI000A067C24|nr:sensor histidine kinase [Herbiconiux solani]